MASLRQNRSKKNKKNTIRQDRADQEPKEVRSNESPTAATPTTEPTSTEVTEKEITTTQSAATVIATDASISEEVASTTSTAETTANAADDTPEEAETAIEFAKNTPDFLLLQKIGKLLHEARCAHGLSIADVAMHLKLRTTQVKAIEEGRAENLPNPIFVRGFIRAYTRFVNMNDDTAINQLIDHWSHAVGLPFISAESKSRHTTDLPSSICTNTQRPHLPKWLFYLAAVVFILAMIFLWQNKSGSLRTEENQEASVLNTVPSAPAISHDNVLVVPLQPTQDTPTAVEDTPNQNELLNDTQQEEKIVAVETIQNPVLAIAIKYRSYLTVRDGHHKVLIDQIVPGGSNFQWNGNNPPYQVRIGYATGSTVEYAGKPFPIDGYINDRTAVFTVPNP